MRGGLRAHTSARSRGGFALPVHLRARDGAGSDWGALRAVMAVSGAPPSDSRRPGRAWGLGYRGGGLGAHLSAIATAILWRFRPTGAPASEGWGGGGLERVRGRPDRPRRPTRCSPPPRANMGTRDRGGGLGAHLIEISSRSFVGFAHCRAPARLRGTEGGVGRARIGAHAGPPWPAQTPYSVRPAAQGERGG